MTISLSEAHLALARTHAAANGFDSVEAYLAHLLEEADARERATAELRAEIDRGIADLDAGRKKPLTAELIEEIKARGRKRAAERRANGGHHG